MTFDELGLSAEVLRAVTEAGYSEPTPIQAQAIPHVLQGRDVMGIAQTGTGKTASFTLPLIDILAAGRPRARMPRSLILEPTRELAAQVAESFEKYGQYHRLSMALLIGGVAFGDQDKKLDRGVDVLIATPGRLLDQYERGKIMLNNLSALVVDEADRMLDMGFIPDLERIVNLLPPSRQTLFFSATMPPEVKRIADAFLTSPIEIAVARPAQTATTVDQHISKIAKDLKRPALRALLRHEGGRIKNAIVFCNRKRDVDIVWRSLQKHGFDAAALHGDMQQSDRLAVLEKFRAGEVALLVASDVAARGLDISDVSHVFNFDVPTHAEDYVHRIGRTGRAGRAGAAFMLATPEDRKYLAAIEKLIQTSINPFDIPDIEIPTKEPVTTSARRLREHRSSHKSEKRGGRGTAKRDMNPGPGKQDTAAETNEPAQRSFARPPDHGDGASVIGFGDHVPAFILTPIRLPTRSSGETVVTEN